MLLFGAFLPLKLLKTVVCPLFHTLVSIDELELLRQIEDYIDIEDAKKALAEPGDNVSAEEVWKQLGL